MKLVPALIGDLPEVFALLESAAQWLLSKGIQQWQTPLPASFINFMQDETSAGHVYLARAGQDEPALATFRIAHQDLPRWGDNGRDKALYVYSLAIRNDLHNTGFGAQVISAVHEMAIQQKIDWLRLDCWAHNQRLQTHYKSLGFSHAGNVDDAGFPLTLFQVSIAPGKRLLL